MNKIKNITLLLLALPLLLTSCFKDDNDIFGESTSKRLQDALSETRSVLRSAENGWVMDYYVGTDQVYGGYAFIVKFDSLSVTAVSEVTRTPATSYYKLTTDNGPVLTFDTYNEVLHTLATPSQTNYEGYHADFEFQIVSATPELVVLRGRRTGNLMQMRPLKGDAQTYLHNVDSIADVMIVDSMATVVGGKNLSAKIDIDNRSIEFSSKDDATLDHSCAFTYTDKGIRLYEDVDFEGLSLSTFSYAPENKTFACLDKGAEQLQIQGYQPTYYMYYEQIAGDYTFTYLSQDQKTLKYDTIDVDVTLEPVDDQSGFNMTGLISGDLKVFLSYSRSTGKLSLNSQQIGTVSGYKLWLNAADFKDGGTLYVGYTACGMDAQWNEDMEKPVLKFKTNDFEDMPTDSYCLWLTNSSGESQGQYRDSQYAFNPGYSIMTFVKSLTKKTPFPKHVE